MLWKKEVPKELGWFWMRSSNATFPTPIIVFVEVININGPTFRFVGCNETVAFDPWTDMEWAGPIPVPTVVI